MIQNNQKFKIVFKEFIFPFIVTALSAFIFFLALRLFIQRSNNNLLSSGVSGIALILARLFSKNEVNQNTIYAVLYFGFNIPIFILGYKSVGKRFALFSFLHVIIASALTSLVPESFINSIDIKVTDPLSIALFGGILSGISTGIVFKVNASGGGMDVIVLYLAIKKGLNSGRYMKLINGTIIVIGGIALQNYTSIFYTLVYVFTSATIVDAIHIRNNKTILQVITTMADEVSEIFISKSRHGCTIFDGKGAYTGKDKQMLFMVVSSFEVSYLVDLMRDVDPNSFVVSTTASNIFGRFYMPPLK